MAIVNISNVWLHLKAKYRCDLLILISLTFFEKECPFKIRANNSKDVFESGKNASDVSFRSGVTSLAAKGFSVLGFVSNLGGLLYFLAAKESKFIFPCLVGTISFIALFKMLNHLDKMEEEPLLQAENVII